MQRHEVIPRELAAKKTIDGAPFGVPVPGTGRGVRIGRRFGVSDTSSHLEIVREMLEQKEISGVTLVEEVPPQICLDPNVLTPDDVDGFF